MIDNLDDKLTSICLLKALPLSFLFKKGLTGDSFYNKIIKAFVRAEVYDRAAFDVVVTYHDKYNKHLDKHTNKMWYKNDSAEALCLILLDSYNEKIRDSLGKVAFSSLEFFSQESVYEMHEYAAKAVVTGLIKSQRTIIKRCGTFSKKTLFLSLFNQNEYLFILHLAYFNLSIEEAINSVKDIERSRFTYLHSSRKTKAKLQKQFKNFNEYVDSLDREYIEDKAKLLNIKMRSALRQNHPGFHLK
jgi:RNase P subunit RPR2